MSTFGSKVVAVLDTTSAFGVTIKQLKENVDSHTAQLNTLLADAPETLDTLNEIAAAISDDPAFFSNMASANTTLQNNIDALQTAAANARTALQTLLQGNIDTKLDKAGGTLTGSLVVHRQFPDLHLKSDEEKRLLFTDAGGGATGAIKNVDSELDFFAGGVTAADKVMSVAPNNVDVSANLTVSKSYPDIELKAGNEKRVLFADAGGYATAGIKHVSTDLDFYAGGIAGSNKELSVGADNVTVHNRLNVDTLNIPIAAPSSPTDGDIYFDKTALKLKVYVDDGSSAAWVQL